MARNGADVLVKKNSKLEAFLTRNLTPDTFESLRTHEACIVCSEKEDKAFKFVVLSDEWIYLTENPPRKVQEVVHYKHIVDIELCNKYPEFLSGEERKNTQHIKVYYRTKEQTGGKSARKSSTGLSPSSPRSPRESLSARSTVSESQYTLEVPSGFDKRLGGSLKLNSSRKSKKERRISLDESSLSKNTKDDIAEDGKLNSPSKKGKSKKKDLKNSATPDILVQDFSKTTASNLASTMKNRYTSSSYDKIRKLPRSLPNPSDEWDETGEYINLPKGQPLKLSTLDSGEFKLNLEALDDSDEDEENDEILKASSTTRSSLGNRKYLSRQLFCLSTSRSLRGSEDDDSDAEWRIAELHLYILSYSSPLLMLARSAWDNYIIRATLKQDEEYLARTQPIGPKKATPGIVPNRMQKMTQLFNQLKTELLDPRNKMEDIYTLLSEMKSGCDRNFGLKKLFWKTADLFEFLVKQLQIYLPKSPSKLNPSSDEFKALRADEFELAILITETISVMFRETEIIASRLTCLRANKGKSILDLIVTLTCFPEMPAKYVPPSNKAAKLLKTYQQDQWKCTADAELSKLVEEFTSASTAVIWEIIIIAHQANWGDRDGNFLNIAWLINLLEELNSTEKFLERLVSQALRLLIPSKREELLPAEAVLLFQQFSVLQTMIEYSPQMTGFIRNNFFEEFKYYVRGSTIREKLPCHYTVALPTAKVIQEVVVAILQKKVDLKLLEYYQSPWKTGVMNES